MGTSASTRESCTPRRRRSKGIKNQAVPISEFGVCVLAIAEHRRVKPADWLAGLVGCTPQAANRYIRGTRPAPDGAYLALLDFLRFAPRTGQSAHK